jgi:hypothetical protein
MTARLTRARGALASLLLMSVAAVGPALGQEALPLPEGQAPAASQAPLAGSEQPPAETEAPAAENEASPAGSQALAESPDAPGLDPADEEARRLFAALDAVLESLAVKRDGVEGLPREEEYPMGSLFAETQEEREQKIAQLLNEALDVVLETSVRGIQDRIDDNTDAVQALEDQLIGLRERRLKAPSESAMEGILGDTVESIEREITLLEAEIDRRQAEIDAANEELRQALARSGVSISPEQFELLRRSVLSADVVTLVAVYNAVKTINGQLAELLGQSGDNPKAARKYFAMHAALLALLAHAQTLAVENIETIYLPRLEAVENETKAARRASRDLLAEVGDPDRRKLLEANMESQDVTLKVAQAYRRYLDGQRRQFAHTLADTLVDVRIADNTVRTVEASLQMLTLIRESGAALDALKQLEAPSFEEIFRNEELLREFENLTSRLKLPAS